MESLAPLLIVVFSFVKKKGLISFLFFHFISFFANMLSFYARAHKLFILSSFFLFWFLQVSFLFELCFVGHGLWITINFLRSLYPSFSFFSFYLFFFFSSIFFLFPLFDSIKVSYFAFVASCCYMLCNLLLFIFIVV